MTESSIEDILENFPFYPKKKERQRQVLSKYLFESPGMNKSETAEVLDVTRVTVDKIEKAWNQLTKSEKALLIDYLRYFYIQKNIPGSKRVSCDKTRGKL